MRMDVLGDVPHRVEAPVSVAVRGSQGFGVADYTREEAARRRATERGGSRTMREWAMMVPERGRPLQLDQFPFQEGLFSEEVARARRVVIRKSSQVGMSMVSWRWAGRQAEQFGERVIYFFPTSDHVNDFSDQRVQPSIDDSAFLLSRIPAHYVQQKSLKQIGAGDISFRGTTSRVAVQSVDADAIVFDEYDELDRSNLALAERRLAGAQAAGRTPRVRQFGTPTVPGFGIDALYEATDRREWHVRCPECETEQRLTFEGSLRWRSKVGGEKPLRAGHDEYEEREDVIEAWRACKECDASLEPPEGEDYGPIHRGRWIALRPDRTVPGFFVHRLIVPRTDLVEIVKNSRQTSPEQVEAFYNSDLGLAYSPSEASLSDEDLDAACSRGRDGNAPISYKSRRTRTGGLDVASERDLSLRIDEHMEDGTRQAIYIGEPKNFSEVAELVRDYGLHLLVVDSMPERRQARALAATFPGRVHLASYDYRDDADAFKFDPKKNLVTINRTGAIDAMMDGIRHQRNAPLRKPPPRYYAQMKAPKRRTELDTKQRPIRVYVSSGTEGDDYAHAEVYALVASEMFALRGQVLVGQAAAQGEVLDETHGLPMTRLETEDPLDVEYDPGFRS